MSSNDFEPKPDPRLELALWRSKCLDDYGGLELSLSSMFREATGLPLDIAEIIFFNIVNTRSRDVILSKILDRQVKNEYQPFYRGLLKEINKAAQIRNNIVHWQVVNEIRQDYTIGMSIPDDVYLMPSAFFSKGPNAPKLTVDDLTSFCDRMDVLSRATVVFTYQAVRPDPDFGAERRNTWHEIFQQQFAYPLPDNHPLRRNRKAPQDQPES